MARAARVWRGLHTLEFNDELSSGGPLTLDTRWKIVAPDKIAYEIKGESSSVIIGDHRWDKPAGAKTFTESAQAPVQQPQPFWVAATDVRLLGTVSVHGRPAWKISFFDPETPGWFTILVDKATMHTVDVRMTAIAHFMHDTYGPFNAPISIVRRVAMRGALLVAVLAARSRSGSATAATRVAPCTGTDLSGTFKAVPGHSQGAGNIVYALRLRNASSSACTVTGVPKVQLLNAKGAKLPTAACRHQVRAPLIALAQNKAAVERALLTRRAGEGRATARPLRSDRLQAARHAVRRRQPGCPDHAGDASV